MNTETYRENLKYHCDAPEEEEKDEDEKGAVIPNEAP